MKYPRTLQHLEEVKVYRNLHNGKLSVIAVNDVGNKSVVAHVDNIALLNPKFIISEAGRQRVLRTRQKNVHGFVTGKVIKVNIDYKLDLPNKITYNPYKYSSFVRVNTEEPVFNLPSALIGANGLISTVH